MCVNPALCGSLPNIQLKGPLGKPPAAGWKITTLPASAQHLNQSWQIHPAVADSAKSALYTLLDFLAVNGVASKDVSSEVYEAAIDQWCHGSDAGENRCPKDYRTLTFSPPNLPWAKDAWETANRALSDDLEADEVKPALDVVVKVLTDLISGPSGCLKCYSKWLTKLEVNPVPASPTLDEARRWLWARHNETRQGHSPVSFEEIEAKFWPKAQSEPII